MATVTRDQGKTAFVKEFLGDNPQGNVQAVNEAWTKSGKDGSIGATLIHKLRSQLGLTGNLRATSKSKTVTERKTAAASKPKTATETPGKTSFVKQFLDEHPDGTTKSVNEAWQAAGFEGMISPTLVNKTRVAMSGKRLRRARTATKVKTAPKVKAAAKNSKPVVQTLGKTSFVKEFLNDNPKGNVTAVNEAWTEAGMIGTISTTLVNKTRALLGLTGNLRGKSEAKATTGKKRGRPRKDTTVVVTVTPVLPTRGRKSDRTNSLLEVEAEIDRLIFTVMGIGELPEVESLLRDARRKIYAALT